MNELLTNEIIEILQENNIGEINIADISHAVDMLYEVGYNPTPPADVNGDGAVTMVDIIILVEMAFND